MGTTLVTNDTRPDPAEGVTIQIRAPRANRDALQFVADLFDMYKAYAERQGWLVSLLARYYHPAGAGKVSDLPHEIIFTVSSRGPTYTCNTRPAPTTSSVCPRTATVAG
jgi:protein subunit release factor A